MAKSSDDDDDDADNFISIFAGIPQGVDNTIKTSRYNVASFLPVALLEQFSKFANLYFLVIGGIMAVGFYTNAFDTAVTPWTTLGPLSVVMTFSLLVEGSADRKRHNSDKLVNDAECVVLERVGADKDLEGICKSVLNGKTMEISSSSSVAYHAIRRKHIRQGHLVLIRNRDMVPADTILLSTSNPGGVAYIETSSIDGETNLKLRASATMRETPTLVEKLENATKRMATVSGLMNVPPSGGHRRSSLFQGGDEQPKNQTNDSVAKLTCEPPNPHINTFSGKLILPDQSKEIPLGADNIVLRGAILRNTEWLLGLSVYTGTDTKLIQNSFKTPSKMSKLDKIMNQIVFAVLGLMVVIMSYLATSAVLTVDRKFDELWYAGLKKESAPWPYHPDLPDPSWQTTTSNWVQNFFLFLTLLSNFVPLSLYITIEAVNFFYLWLIQADQDMYDATTDTRALARSTNVSDLGQIEYIFSDKTGTLTQNVMVFKRCSVDGMVFGKPIVKASQRRKIDKDTSGEQEEEPEQPAEEEFHPLRQLLVGGGGVRSCDCDDDDMAPPTAVSLRQKSEGLISMRPGQNHLTDSPTGVSKPTITVAQDKPTLTFNSEMFLRTMALCHTVVVEKDLDLSDQIDTQSMNSASSRSSWHHAAKRLLTTIVPARLTGIEHVISGSPSHQGGVGEHHDPSTLMNSLMDNLEKGPDGAPMGYAYQAESPDEGALVSAASKSYGFQVIGRDSTGIILRTAHPSVLGDGTLIKHLQRGRSLKCIAAETAGEFSGSKLSKAEANMVDPDCQRTEVWKILAVNKFESDRKRMSILLESPPNLGSLKILFCKGADSAMLDPAVCIGAQVEDAEESERSKRVESMSEFEKDDAKGDDWEAEMLLGMQSHLGTFASEGLRTLVLGVRILTDAEASSWLEMYQTASTAIKNRDEKLKQAALAVEKNLHVVGATAIEDKLQTGVPKTIATLGKAGIKLWVLTGDKRETAVEIGYSTQVLQPQMRLTQVPDKGPNYVQAQCAMEFLRLVKAGKLSQYQRAVVDQDPKGCSWENVSFHFGNMKRRFRLMLRGMYLSIYSMMCNNMNIEAKWQDLEVKKAAERNRKRDVYRRRAVRDRAEQIVKEYLRTAHANDPAIMNSISSMVSDNDNAAGFPLISNNPLEVFTRANSAKDMLKKRRSTKKITDIQKRSLSIANLTSEYLTNELKGENTLSNAADDILSLKSFVQNDADLQLFNKKRRTALERLFATDKEVRKGKLINHLKRESRHRVLAAIEENDGRVPDILPAASDVPSETDAPSALVIEGAALTHLLGDSELEEILFGIGSNCKSVIACRVSPRQKALLVGLVREYVTPEPVTLAIGDGANDVGMIQEAHVGIGISGKEGKQAVNASDFAIAQFRFLENLVLIHGRWNFFRLSTVVLFSFYKNALMAGCLVVFNSSTVYSGQPLFDDWVIAVLNFVAGLPIMVLGLFDRCLEKDYIKRNPIVYKATRKNELITTRVLIRWVILTIAHILIVFYATVPQLSLGGGMSAAFQGLSSTISEDHPGEAEGGDLTSVGTITYTASIFILALKVIFESKSPIHGQWPAISCKRKVDGNDGFFSRLAWTWVGISWGSIIFYFFFLMVYSQLGKAGPSSFFGFVGVTEHVLGTRSINWMLIGFVPIFAMIFDLSGKVFSNMFYPTNTQIHIEIDVEERRQARNATSSHDEVEEVEIQNSSTLHV